MPKKIKIDDLEQVTGGVQDPHFEKPDIGVDNVDGVLKKEKIEIIKDIKVIKK